MGLRYLQRPKRARNGCIAFFSLRVGGWSVAPIAPFKADQKTLRGAWIPSVKQHKQTFELGLRERALRRVVPVAAQTKVLCAGATAAGDWYSVVHFNLAATGRRQPAAAISTTSTKVTFDRRLGFVQGR